MYQVNLCHHLWHFYQSEHRQGKLFSGGALKQAQLAALLTAGKVDSIWLIYGYLLPICKGTYQCVL
jgi:hypothetical protein